MVAMDSVGLKLTLIEITDQKKNRGVCKFERFRISNQSLNRAGFNGNY